MARFISKLIASVFVSLSVASVQAFASEDENSSTEVDTEFRLTGDEKICLNKRDVKWFMAVDRNTLLFATDDSYYFNNLLSNCNLAVNANLKIKFYSGGRTNYCKGDGLITQGAGSGSMRCVLNRFQQAVEVSGSAE